MEQLKNFGIETIGDSKNIKTIVVVGIARSGTSLVAGVLDKLGVFTGEKSKPPVFEDVLLAQYMEENDFDKVKEIILKYDKKHKLWAFKRPSVIDYLEKMDTLWTKPYYIFIFKDLVSIANRNKLSMKLDFINNLIFSYKEMGKIINFIENKKINGMFLSYEKIILNPEKFIREFVKILNIGVSKEQLKDIKSFITPNPIEYLDQARITKTIGVVDFISSNKIMGWIKYLYKNEAVNVELYINNKFIAKTTANKYRKDLKKIHPKGKCVFIFDLNNIKIKPSDKIEFKVEGDITSIKFGKQALEFFIRGNIDTISSKKISGWAIDYLSENPVDVYLYKNDKLISIKKANQYRKDLKKIHPKGKCGFIFKLEDEQLKADDKIDIKINDKVSINFSKQAQKFF